MDALVVLVSPRAEQAFVAAVARGAGAEIVESELVPDGVVVIELRSVVERWLAGGDELEVEV